MLCLQAPKALIRVATKREATIQVPRSPSASIPYRTSEMVVQQTLLAQGRVGAQAPIAKHMHAHLVSDPVSPGKRWFMSAPDNSSCGRLWVRALASAVLQAGSPMLRQPVRWNSVCSRPTGHDPQQSVHLHGADPTRINRLPSPTTVVHMLRCRMGTHHMPCPLPCVVGCNAGCALAARRHM